MDSKVKIYKSDTETKDEVLDSIPKIMDNNKSNSYILVQVRIEGAVLLFLMLSTLSNI